MTALLDYMIAAPSGVVWLPLHQSVPQPAEASYRTVAPAMEAEDAVTPRVASPPSKPPGPRTEAAGLLQYVIPGPLLGGHLSRTRRGLLSVFPAPRLTCMAPPTVAAAVLANETVCTPVWMAA